MKQKFDNQAMRGERVAKAKSKVSELVKKGYRLNPNKASQHYLQSVQKFGSLKEKLQTRNQVVGRMGKGGK